MRARAMAGLFVAIVFAAIGAPVGSGAQQNSQVKNEGKVDGTGKTTVTAKDTQLTWRPVSLFERFADDQRSVWTAPFHARASDTDWLMPLGAVTAGLLATDRSSTAHLSQDPVTLRHYRSFSNDGVAALMGAAGGLALWSLKTGDAHQRETGFLAAESIVNSFVILEGLKYAAGRERPFQGTGDGRFRQGGTSFPSEHAAAAWAAAGILAHEYPGPLTKFLVYGLASAVSYSRVRGREHFPSDVLIGGAIGWLVSQHMYNRHHQPELGGAEWGGGAPDPDGESPDLRRGSSYVPLDSWVYSAVERLAGLGYLDSSFAGLKPWSRTQCLRFVDEARERWNNQTDPASTRSREAAALLEALDREFRGEGSAAAWQPRFAVDSIYSRVISVSGPVLTDGYHFGQTYAYDFGRPFRRGLDEVTGASAHAELGSLFLYVRGEFQHSPSAPALSPAQLQFIADRDRLPLGQAAPFSAVDRLRLLDAYVGMNVHGWQISFGKQSLEWGPGPGGSLLLSNNAEPIPMLRISPVEARQLPGLLKFLGPVRFEQFYGRLDGHNVASQPWIYGQKISIKPLPSLEFSYGRTTLVGGTGHPLTAGNFFRSLTGRVDPATGSVPGDSRSSADWTWRLPGLRNTAVFYGEFEADDDVFPLEALPNSVLRPGIYLTRLPALPKWDLHFEWTSSESPGRHSFQCCGNLNYWNQDYRDGYTNNGGLLGNTVGRDGRGLQAWTRWWISPTNTFDFTWKQSKVLGDYVPGGASWQDVRADYGKTLASGAYFKALLQVEHIEKYPLLFSGPRNNVTASVELGFLPAWRKARGAAPSDSSAEVTP